MQYVNGNNFDFSGDAQNLPEIFLFDTVLDTSVPTSFTSVKTLIANAHKARCCLGSDGQTTIVAGSETYIKYCTNLKFTAPEMPYTYDDLITAKSGTLVSYEDYTVGEENNRMSWLVPEWTARFIQGYNGGDGYISFYIRSQVANNTVNCRPKYEATLSSLTMKNAVSFSAEMNFGSTNSAVGSINTAWDCRMIYRDTPTYMTKPFILTIRSFSRSGGLVDPPDHKGTRPLLYMGMGGTSPYPNTENVKPNLMAFPVGDAVLTLTSKDFTVNNGNACLPGKRYPIDIAVNIKGFNIPV